jgi:NAD(P)H-flavin reductase
MRHISMIAGGTGITPMYQILKAILEEPNNETKMALVYSCSTINDIALRRELDDLAARYPGTFQLWYTLSKPPKDPKEWLFGRGRISKKMMREWLFDASESSLALMCGPPAMIEKVCIPELERMGYVYDENLFAF